MYGSQLFYNFEKIVTEKISESSRTLGRFI